MARRFACFKIGKADTFFRVKIGWSQKNLLFPREICFWQEKLAFLPRENLSWKNSFFHEKFTCFSQEKLAFFAKRNMLFCKKKTISHCFFQELLKLFRWKGCARASMEEKLLDTSFQAKQFYQISKKAMKNIFSRMFLLGKSKFLLQKASFYL